MKGDFPMLDWLTVLKLGAEIVSVGKAWVGFARDVYRWFENVVGGSPDQQARKVWEDFKRDPEKHKEALAQVAVHLKPDNDPALNGYVLGFAKQKLQANRARIYGLLSGSRYTTEQVQDICMRIDPALPGLSKNSNKQDFAHWAVNLASTRDTLWDILISNMLEINPEVLSDVVALA
jgi:hypothetical protein